ncbi:hypothetical protein R3P38DRAFT_2899570 [Favolaschia claudopus]|uniref:Uncharacterized protein n=1 Tax=Favolaschia claudopus TaxID=2862362 RepID=A0AAW0CLS5_9AGAR
MPKPTKDAAYSQEHVQERALERYGLELDAEGYKKLNIAVRRARTTLNEESTVAAGSELPTTDATLLNDEGGDEQIWGVGWGSQTLICVWSVSLDRVTTLLPEGTVVTRRKGTKPRKGKK